MYKKVDYSREKQERGQLGKYLRAGAFKKVGGAPLLANSIRKRRIIVVLLSIIVIIVGLFYSFF